MRGNSKSWARLTFLEHLARHVTLKYRALETEGGKTLKQYQSSTPGPGVETPKYSSLVQILRPARA